MFLAPLLPLAFRSHAFGSEQLGPNDRLKNSRLQILRVLHHLFARRQLDVGFLPVAPMPFGLAASPQLAVINRRAHLVDFHVERRLHSLFDLRFGGLARHFEYSRLLRFFHAETLFRDDRPANDFVRLHGLFLVLFRLGLGVFFRRGLLLRFLCVLFRRGLGFMFSVFRLRGVLLTGLFGFGRVLDLHGLRIAARRFHFA